MDVGLNSTVLCRCADGFTVHRKEYCSNVKSFVGITMGAVCLFVCLDDNFLIT